MRECENWKREIDGENKANNIAESKKKKKKLYEYCLKREINCYTYVNSGNKMPYRMILDRAKWMQLAENVKSRFLKN